LEQKKEDLELIRAEDTMIEDKNIIPQSQKLGTARANPQKPLLLLSASWTSYLLVYL